MMVYKGCFVGYADGHPCELKNGARCEKRSGTHKHGKYARERDDHICVSVDHGVAMFCFTISVNEFEVIDVYKLLGIQLLGMSGQDWDRAYDPAKLPQSVVDRNVQSRWTMIFVTKWKSGGICIRKDVNNELF